MTVDEIKRFLGKKIDKKKKRYEEVTHNFLKPMDFQEQKVAPELSGYIEALEDIRYFIFCKERDEQ